MLSRLELGRSWVLVLCNAMEISVEETLLLFRCASTVRTIVVKNALKTAHFHLKMDHRVAPRHGTCHIEHPFNILWWPNRYETTTALIRNPYVADQPLSSTFRTIVLKTAQKGPFLDTKLAIEWARRLETARNWFVVMRLCSPVVLSYLDAGFEPPCRRKDFSCVCYCCCCCCCCCLLLLLLKRVAHPWTLKGGVKPRQGKPSSVKMCCTPLDPKMWGKTPTGETKRGNQESNSDRAGSWSCLTHWKLLRKEDRLLCTCCATVRTIFFNCGSKTAHFHLKMDHGVAPRHGTCLIGHRFAFL